jgi:hypothetical protein
MMPTSTARSMRPGSRVRIVSSLLVLRRALTI